MSSREETIHAIDDCSDLQSLYELVNPAIGGGREAWGDQLLASSAASLFWRSCSFIGAAQERVQVTEGHAIRGSELVALSLALAKTVARELLAPMPEREWGQEEELTEASWRIKKKARALADSVASKLEPFSGVDARPNSFFKRSLFFGAIADRMLHDEPGVWMMRNHPEGWEQERAKITSPKGQATCEAGALARALKEAALAGGFAACGAGPLGGAAAGVELARRLQDASAELARALALDSSRAAGLGGALAYLNCHQGGSGASFDPGQLAFSFSDDFHSFGHEWTHALESVWLRCEPERAKECRAELLRAIKTAPADPEESRRLLDPQDPRYMPEAKARLDEGANAFMARAAALDKTRVGFGAMGVHETYWSCDSEIIARVAEGRFHDRSSLHELVRQTNAAGPVIDYDIPHGQERERMGQAYAQWVLEARPLLSRLDPHSATAGNAAMESGSKTVADKLRSRRPSAPAPMLSGPAMR